MLSEVTGSSCFLCCFRRIVEAHGAQAALREGGHTVLTYQALASRASAVGAWLREAGVGREDVVGLSLPKSPEYIVALLGVWWAGAAFLPLDPALPAARTLAMAEEAEVAALLTGGELDATTTRFAGLGVPCLSVSEVLEGPVEELDWPVLSAQQLAYVIYTSGSTGKPKGVMVTHAGLVAMLQAQIATFGLRAGARALFYLSTNFDASVSDIGSALLSGATLCFAPPCVLQPGPAFVALLHDEGITHMDIPPSVLGVLAPESMPPSLETVMIGGEVCPPEVVRRWATKVRLIGIYGPTEATVCTSMCVCTPDWERALIGQPLAHLGYHVLDAQMRALPPGEAGELWISGPGLARGYLKRPTLTQTKFVEHQGIRMYRTGDRVCRHEDGEFEFLGRVDRQFKLRGQLVEPEEVEVRLMAHPSIRRAAVLKRPLHIPDGRERLVAFVSTAEGEKLPPAKTLREELARTLPRWMLPQRFVVLDSLPTTVTGKVDLAALASLPLSQTLHPEKAISFADPRAMAIAEVWQAHLGVEEIGLEDDFFALGGDSFGLLEVSTALQAKGISLSPALLMEATNIAAILELLDATPPTREHLQPLLAAGEQTDARDLPPGRDDARDIPPGRDDACGLPLGQRETLSCDWLRRQVALDAVWQDRLTKASARQGDPPGRPQRVLLTGATGFLGSRLLHQLLTLTDATFCCLVRAKTPVAAKKRIEDALSVHGLSLQRGYEERIRPLCGDLTQESFGLSATRWEELATQIDTIYHCAAVVHNLLSYRALYAANVFGTQSIAHLLCEGRKKALHYASTLSVFVSTDQNTGLLREDDSLDQTCEVVGGYAQTKWAAEVFLRSLGEAAGPISHYRFGLLAGDSITGRTSTQDFLALFFRGLAALGKVPSRPHDIAVDVTPIDFAAAAFAHISLQPEAAASTFHIANPQHLKLKSIIQNMRDFGIFLEEAEPEQFWALLQNQLAPEALAAGLALCRCFPSPEAFSHARAMDLFQATGATFSMSRTLRLLEGTQIVCPPPSPSLLQRYLRQSF